jgi:ribosome-associated protein
MEKGSGAFTDYFVLCSGTNPRQVQAIADEVELRLKKAGLRPTHVEGYSQAEWVLVDYVDFVVHVFSEKARKFYDLERLWKSARRLEPGDLKTTVRARKTATKLPAKKRKVRA